MKRKQILNTIMITILGGLLFSACQKSDIAAVNTTDQEAEEKFFNSHIAAKPATRAVQEYIRRENGRRPVVKGLLQKAGIPRWDKALIFDNVELPSGRGSALGDSTTILHIPFVFANEQMVTGSLMVKMAPGDTTMNLVSANDYASYGFGNATANTWNARDVFNILTRLDYEVFGRTKYIVNDGRIVGDSQHIRHRVTIDQTAQQTLNDLFVTLNVCNSQTVCIIAGEPGSSPGVCNTYWYCTTYYIEIPGGGGSGGGSGGGTGGGPTGGGGTGGTGGTGGPIVTGWIGWEDDDEEVAKYADIEWDVYYIPQPLGGGAVLSTDRFFGRFRANHPENNRFTSGAHLNNRLVANSDANFVCGTWGVTLNSNTLATAVCGGTITFTDGKKISIEKTKTVHLNSLPWQ